MKTENKNFLLNIIYQVLIYLFPLITTPYISRILKVDNIGIYSYTYSIVNIFMLFAMLGINNYGNRAVAKVRDDKEKLSLTFFSIYFLQLFLAILSIIVYLILVFFVFNREYKIIFLIQGIALLSVAFDINWFYFGLEKFKITISRNLVIKLLSVILIFIFVKNENDLWKYTLIMTTAILSSQFFLVVLLKKFVVIKKIPLKIIFSHFKGCFILFIPVLAYAIYRVMDKIMIGYISSTTELGYYENAEKIINIPIAIITALGTVMLPRMSYLLTKGNKDDFKIKINESMKLALSLSTIMAFGIIIIADEASLILFGAEFIKSSNIMRFLSLTIIASAWANVIRTQYLIPRNKDKIYLISTFGGAVINLICNFIFIKPFGSYGACIGTIAAEFFVAIYQGLAVRKELDIKKYSYFLLKNIIINGIITLLAYLFAFKISNLYIRFFVMILLSIILYVILNYRLIFNEFFGIRKRSKNNE